MKKTIILSLLVILVLPILVMGCSKTSAANETSDKQTKSIEISIDEFSTENNITRDVELSYPGTLVVTLGSNPSTGYQWNETPVLVTASKYPILSQESHEFIAPQSTDGGIVGAPGKEVWVFDSIRTGYTAISFNYSRPWEGGDKDTWTLSINVNVQK